MTDSLQYKPIVTVMDVLETGACMSGVAEWVVAHGGRIAGEAARFHRNEYIRKAAHADGDGDGDGYGDGDGLS